MQGLPNLKISIFGFDFLQQSLLSEVPTQLQKASRHTALNPKTVHYTELFISTYSHIPSPKFLT